MFIITRVRTPKYHVYSSLALSSEFRHHVETTVSAVVSISRPCRLYIHSSNLKIEVTNPKPVLTHKTTRRHITEDNNLHCHWCADLVCRMCIWLPPNNTISTEEDYQQSVCITEDSDGFTYCNVLWNFNADRYLQVFLNINLLYNISF
jgi:hypothetical protein